MTVSTNVPPVVNQATVTGILPVANGGTGASSFTAGSIIFSNGSILTQNNAKCFWNDTDNSLLIGKNTNSITIAGSSVKSGLIVHGGPAASSSTGQFHWHSNTDTARHLFARSRGNPTVQTIVSSGDILGDLQFVGHDGTDYEYGASLRVEVDGTPGSNNMPGRFLFLTTPSGSATPIERLRISANGDISHAGMTSGSVLFAGTGGLISQNNSAFFWDNALLQLKLLGTANPQLKLLYDASNTATFQVTSAGNMAMTPSGTVIAIDKSSAGNTLTYYVANQDNSNVNSKALFQCISGGASAGDAWFNFRIGYSATVADWSLGIDNSDSDKFKISAHSLLGTNDVMAISSTGYVQFVGPSPWIDVMAYGATGDGSTDDTTAITNAIAAIPSGGATLFFPVGTFKVTGSGLTITNRKVKILGCGKNASVISYTGSGTALTCGSAGSPGSNDGFAIESIGITGTSSGAVGLDLIIFNHFLLQDIRVKSFSNGSGIRFNGSNTGTIINVESDNNSVGLKYAANTTYNPNHISVIGGTLTGNATAISAVDSSQANKVYGVNIASTSTSPAIDVRAGVGWEIKQNYFENNTGGASTAIISLGAAGTSSNGNLVISNYFTEANSPTYFVKVVKGIGNQIWGNYLAGTPATAFARCDTNAQLTTIWGNTDPSNAITILSDASGSVDQFTMGQNCDLTKDAYGFVFNKPLAGTASAHLQFRSHAAGKGFQFLDSSGTQSVLMTEGGFYQGPLGAASTPTLALGTTSTGIYSASSGADVSVSIGGTRYLAIQANNIQLLSDTGTIYLGAGADTTIARSSGNIILTPAGTKVGIKAGANGQQIDIEELTELTTIAAAATTDTAIQIPANAVVFAVSVRVTVVIPTAATFTVTGTTSATQFDVAGGVSTAANTTDIGTANCPYKNGAAQTIRITPNAVPAANTGRVRVTIHFYRITPATS